MRRLIIIFGFLYLWFPDVCVYAQNRDSVPDSQLVIKDIIIEGNKVTKEKIILRELVFQKGDTLAKMDLIPGFNRSRDNIKNLSSFNFVSPCPYPTMIRVPGRHPCAGLT